MEEELERRIAANEALVRDVNEAIARGQWPGDPEAVGFRCECAMLGCNDVIELTPSEYERVRAHPRRFVIVPGHDQPQVEKVVETRPGYAVVEKVEEAGQEAEKTDPR
jgi:hypothetical protein